MCHAKKAAVAFGDSLLSGSLTSRSTPILLVTGFDLEFVNNYELSDKAVFDNGLSINANLFYLDWADMQTRGTELVSTGTFNVGESTVYGGELELTPLIVEF